jgi:hypothetical protein
MSRPRFVILMAMIAVGLGLSLGPGWLPAAARTGAQVVVTPPPALPVLEEPTASAFSLPGPVGPHEAASPAALPVTPGLAYRTFSGLAFQVYDSRDQLVYNFGYSGRALLTTTALLPAEMTIPLQLPQGARVQELLFYFRDNSSANLTLGLVRIPLDTTAIVTVLTTTTNISSTEILSRNLVISPAWVIDNSQNEYVILASLNDFDPQQLIRGVRVGYTVATVLLPLVLRQ